MWIDEFGFDQGIIDEALSKTRGAQRPTIRFVTAVLKDWHERGLNSLEGVQAYEEARREDASRFGAKQGVSRDNRDNFSLDESEFDTPMPRIDGQDD